MDKHLDVQDERECRARFAKLYPQEPAEDLEKGTSQPDAAQDAGIRALVHLGAGSAAPEAPDMA